MKALNRSSFMVALFAAVLALYAQVSAAPVAPPNFGGGASSQYVADEVLVKFRPMTPAQVRAATVAARSHALLANLNQTDWVQVKLGPGQGMEAALAVYRDDPNVEYVQPNYIYRATAVPNDTQYGQLWALKNIGQTITTGTYVPNSGTAGNDMNLEPAWDHITDCSSVVVAVIDTGINYNQEDLAASMWDGGASFPKHGIDYVDNDNDPMDLQGHGTHVGGIIGAAGNNTLGTTGVCWKASIMAVRALGVTGIGTTATIIQGINFAVAQGAKVINMSLGGSSAFDQTLSNAISTAQSNDVVVIVAAGNENNNNDVTAVYPCRFTQPNLVCVAALDQNYALASFSNWGAASVDVGAPGTNVLSAWAGTETTITDNFNTGGVLNWTASGGGWAYRPLISGTPVDVLANPATFPTGTYSNNADNRVYKGFDLSGTDVATLSFFAQIAVQAGDSLNLNYRRSGGDPFAGGVQLTGGSATTGGIVGPFSFDLSPCNSSTCSVGFQLLTNGSITAQGVGILGFSIATMQLNTTTYNTISGTSMATPEVAGLAAMLRAYNPLYTYADTVNAIKNGGRSVPALAGKTTTGKAVNAMSSLAFINSPTGLTATVQ